MRAVPVLFCLSLLLSGCTAPGPGAPAPAAPGVLVLSEPVRVVDQGLARETAIEQHPDGTLFVAGYPGTAPEPWPLPAEEPFSLSLARDWATTPPGLWRSTDDGATWAFVDTGTVADGALGNSDVDLALAPDGTLYLASMTFNVAGGPVVGGLAGSGMSIAVGASPDAGATWRWSVPSTQALVDRPWVEVAPDGTAHVVWNDGANVHHASSADRGAEWTEGPLVHTPGGDGTLAIAPDGTLAVRIIPASGSGNTEHPGNDGVAVSEDGGASWTYRPLPGNRDYQSIPGFLAGQDTDFYRWADPVAFDANGTLYAAWGEDEALLLARSADLGATWDVVPLVEGAGTLPVFPHLRAHPAQPGTLAVSWFTREDAGAVAHVALAEQADGAPRLVRAEGFITATDGDTAGEYFQVAFLRDGRLGFANTVQTAEEGGFEYRTARRS